MNYVVLALALLTFNVSRADEGSNRIDYPFFGDGHCSIQSNPCSNGVPISCYAAGAYSGNCSLQVNGDIWTVNCIAYGDGIRTVTQSCHKP